MLHHQDKKYDLGWPLLAEGLAKALNIYMMVHSGPRAVSVSKRNDPLGHAQQNAQAEPTSMGCMGPVPPQQEEQAQELDA